MQSDAPTITAPAATDRDVACPLCGYNLRGLVEPRCPECGYAFAWDELLDPNGLRHPYLFEHHPGRSVRTFLHTYLAALLPRRFWRTLQPRHEIRPRRLAAYYVITTALYLVAPFMMLAVPYAQVVAEQVEQRELQRFQLTTNADSRFVQEVVRRYGSVQAYLDTLPSPYWGKWTRALALHRTKLDAASIGLTCTVLAWPWATFVTLMIFRTTMRRTKVTRGHVLRCALYSCDWPLWLGTFALLVFTAQFAEERLPIFYPAASVPILAAALFAPYTSYRLGSAYAQYLRFPRPYETAIVTQFIALLAVMAIATWATF